MSSLRELGPESTTSLYGLFDTQLNFFYLVYFEKSVIEFLADLIRSVRPVSVIALHSCCNWHRNIVDNTNCTQWGLDAFLAEFRSQSLISDQVSLIENPNSTSAYCTMLSANLNHVLKTLCYQLPVNQRIFEYKVPEKIQTMFADDPWFTQAMQIEIQHNKNNKILYDEVMDEIVNSIQSTRIDQENFCNTLDLKIKSICLGQDLDFFLRKEICLI